MESYSGTESQGFAIQEMMASNLPLLVWNCEVNHYGSYILSGTSVTVWDELCGMVLSNFSEIEKNYENFLKNIDKYRPGLLVEKKLTYEVFNTQLKEYFNFFNYLE